MKFQCLQPSYVLDLSVYDADSGDDQLLVHFAPAILTNRQMALGTNDVIFNKRGYQYACLLLRQYLSSSL